MTALNSTLIHAWHFSDPRWSLVTRLLVLPQVELILLEAEEKILAIKAAALKKVLEIVDKNNSSSRVDVGKGRLR